MKLTNRNMPPIFEFFLKHLQVFVLLGVCIFQSPEVSCHGGGTKRSGPLKGCHNDKNRGSFHCHSKSKYNGKKWESESDAFKWLNKKLKNSENKFKPYDRSKFQHWEDYDGDCQDQRSEILIERSQSIVKFQSQRRCNVASGHWQDFYYADSYMNARDIHIDHVVSLNDAWISGASSWTDQKRRIFANDKENLVITGAKYNMSKGAQTPLSWSPIDKVRACKYLSKYIKIKKKYKLIMDGKIQKMKDEMTCFKGRYKK